MEGQGKLTITCKGCLSNLELRELEITVKIIWDDRTWTGRCAVCGWEPKSTLEIKQMMFETEDDNGECGDFNIPL